ncbi:MAG: hypothetical protein JWN38_229 [Candidatus Saccharibacteria bacterium]|nr:hypothetical protein [Candidatus Saccharibacteria bacterium]
MFPRLALADTPGDSTEIALRSIGDVTAVLRTHYDVLRAEMAGGTALAAIDEIKHQTKTAEEDTEFVQAALDLLPAQINSRWGGQEMLNRQWNGFRVTDPADVQLLRGLSFVETSNRDGGLAYVLGTRPLDDNYSSMLIGSTAIIRKEYGPSSDYSDMKRSGHLGAVTVHNRSLAHFRQYSERLLNTPLTEAELVELYDFDREVFILPANPAYNSRLPRLQVVYANKKTPKRQREAGIVTDGLHTANKVYGKEALMGANYDAYRPEVRLTELAAAFHQEVAFGALLQARVAKRRATAKN